MTKLVLHQRDDRLDSTAVEPNLLNQNESTHFSNSKGGAHTPTPPENNKSNHTNEENI